MKAILTLCSLCLLSSVFPAHGDTFVVKPDGTGDFPVIQAAVDGVSDGDEILLADGVYQGMGNSEVKFWGKAITIRSQSGRPVDCIIDPEGTILAPLGISVPFGPHAASHHAAPGEAFHVEDVEGRLSSGVHPSKLLVEPQK